MQPQVKEYGSFLLSSTAKWVKSREDDKLFIQFLPKEGEFLFKTGQILFSAVSVRKIAALADVALARIT